MKLDDVFQIAPMRSPLSDIEIQRDLGSLNGWSRRGNELVKTYDFPTFADGIAFVNRVARAADALDHHPDIDIRYTRVTFHLSTHSAGGITKQDFKLAAAIEEAVE
jgi:4a-hydroxytetrahydrobiopterin dehydratase